MTKRDELIALGGVGVKVKLLEWQRIGDCWKADRYSIRIDHGVPVYYIVRGWDRGTNPHDTLDAAKAAAQADYEARIKSALVEVPAVKGEPEPVAWPANLSPRTLDLVQRFALALAKKLRLAEEKYGHTDGWLRDDWEAECRDHLYQHLEKGDPRDVAAYCAFMWHHGWITYRPEITAPPADAGMREALEEARERLLNIWAGRCPGIGCENDPVAFRDWATAYADAGVKSLDKALTALGATTKSGT